VSVTLSVIYTECHIQALNAECRYAECRYAECRYASAIMLRVVMLSIVAPDNQSFSGIPLWGSI
jgi:hypothetical protein